MEYFKYEQKYEKQVVDLWNRCLFFDNITVDKFRKQAILDDNFDSNLCWCAVDDEKVVGFLMSTKRKFPYLERGLEPTRGWINVMFVDEQYRRQGIGQRLYDYCEKTLIELGVKEITLAAYSPNYFFGGLDVEHYPEAAAFFNKNGYQDLQRHYSMGRSIENFQLSSTISKRLKDVKKLGYQFIHFDYIYCLELLEFLKEEFGGGWKRSALLSMRANTAQDLIILVLDPKGKICGFSMSSIDGNPERFGPIGIARSKRNDGLGSILLEYSFAEMSKRGIKKMFFMTTDEAGRRYYERNGLTIIRTCDEYRKAI